MNHPIRFAWKLVHLRRDGSIGSLFINRKHRLPALFWLCAADHPTKGYAHRPGWHCCAKRSAPHLCKRHRIWVKVCIRDYVTLRRPRAQGGTWFIAQQMLILPWPARFVPERYRTR